MDDIEDDARYPPKPYGVSHHQGYGYMNHQKLPVRNSPYSQPVANEYGEDNNDEDEEDEEQLEEEEDDDVDQSNSVQLSQRDADDNDDEEDDTDGDGDENNDNNDDDDGNQESYAMKIEDDLERHPKKRKVKSLISTYEFAPRVPAPSAAAPSAPKPSFGGRNSLTDWTEHETFVLLDAWGDRFLQLRKKSLRSEEWQEVAEKVSEVSKIERTDTQCRNRLDTLKKKYKKEKIKFPEVGGGASKWVYFRRMDKLMSSPQQAGLSCGLDSGEYDFMSPRVYLNRANGLDEMRDSPENTESNGEEGSDGPQAKKRRKRRDNDEASSFRLLADSIQKFSKIYEKIENSRRQQMVELEKMRMEFHKELETQNRQILERLQSEILKLEQRDDENDDSAENGVTYAYGDTDTCFGWGHLWDGEKTATIK